MRILIGSSRAQSIHAVVASTAAEKASWLTGIALVPAAPGGITLSTDADLLGSGTDQLESLSLVAVSAGAETLLDVPTGPVGERRTFEARLSPIAGSCRLSTRRFGVAAPSGRRAE